MPAEVAKVIHRCKDGTQPKNTIEKFGAGWRMLVQVPLWITSGKRKSWYDTEAREPQYFEMDIAYCPHCGEKLGEPS